MGSGTFTLLGTGASTGIPCIACTCPVCTSSNSHNKRLRTAAWIEYQNQSFLIDVSPDFREQALKYHIKRVDGIFITHTHFDHIGGLEELRIFNFMQQKAIPCVLSKESYKDIQKLYYYHFTPKNDGDTFSSKMDFDIKNESQGKGFLGTLAYSYFRYTQGSTVVLGFRFGNIAYITDIKNYSDDLFSFLEGIDTLIVSALRFQHSSFHFTIDEASDFAKKIAAKRSYFIHIAHEVDHEKVNALLPSGIALGFDGLSITFET